MASATAQGEAFVTAISVSQWTSSIGLALKHRSCAALPPDALAAAQGEGCAIVHQLCSTCWTQLG